ncbi:MAG: tetratricopeptide repeat protein [Alphaproteobacteria bacterium]|nr:tetratricopeptide repeat protein [Alphaproteobacteria bacterium]
MSDKHRAAPRFKTMSAIALAIVLSVGLGLTGLAHAAGSSGGGSLPQQSRPQINPEQSYRDGVAALSAGDYKTAEKKFGEVLSVSRKHAEANYYMGLAKVGRGKHKASVRYFERAIKYRPGFVEAHEQLALAFVTLGKTDDAQEQLSAMRAISENCADATCDGAYRQRIGAAIATVEAALGIGEGDTVSFIPNTAPQFSMLALAPRAVGAERYGDAVKLINQQRFAEAVSELYRAQAIIGPHPDILNYLGFAHRKLGKFDRAQDYYAAALELDPDHLGATEYLGELYLELGEIKKARRQLAKLDRLCAFGCAQYEDLARLIEVKTSIRRAAR